MQYTQLFISFQALAMCGILHCNVSHVCSMLLYIYKLIL